MSGSRKPRLSMSWLLFGGLLAFVAWAALFHIDQAVRAQGQIIPAARTQIIQAVDGGVLSRILVQEGQGVARGQLLASLEREHSSASFEESQAKDAALRAALARALAEAEDRPLAFDPVLRAFPQFTGLQRALYVQRKHGLEQELATLHEALAMSAEELRMNEALLRTGDISRVEVMRAQRQVIELRGKIDAVRNKYRQDARLDAAKLAEEISATAYRLDDRKNTLDHTELKAPVAGVVKYLKVTTIGGVLRPGDELMQISPTEGEMVVELKISPADIGQLRPGLPVTLQVDAFDYAIYGAWDGELDYVSSDTLSEPTAGGQTAAHYRARVRIHDRKQAAGARLPAAALRPGMTVTAQIRTGRRSVLQYLAKPLFKAFDGALLER